MGMKLKNIIGIRAMHIIIGSPGIVIGSPGIVIGSPGIEIWLNIDASRRGHTNKGPNSKTNNLGKFGSLSFGFFGIVLKLRLFLGETIRFVGKIINYFLSFPVYVLPLCLCKSLFESRGLTKSWTSIDNMKEIRAEVRVANQ